MRAAGGPMSGAERAEKKQVRASLFPQKQLAHAQKDVARKRQKSTAAKAAQTAGAAQEQLHQKMQQQQQRHGMFRWPMTVAERLDKRALCEDMRWRVLWRACVRLGSSECEHLRTCVVAHVLQ